MKIAWGVMGRGEGERDAQKVVRLFPTSIVPHNLLSCPFEHPGSQGGKRMAVSASATKTIEARLFVCIGICYKH